MIRPLSSTQFRRRLLIKSAAETNVGVPRPIVAGVAWLGMPVEEVHAESAPMFAARAGRGS